MIIRLFLMIMMILSSHYYEKKWRWHGCVCLCSKCTYEKKNIRTLDCSFFRFFFFFFWYSLVVESLLFLFEIFFFVREKQNLNIFFGHQILLDFYCMNYEENWSNLITRLIDWLIVILFILISSNHNHRIIIIIIIDR